MRKIIIFVICLIIILGIILLNSFVVFGKTKGTIVDQDSIGLPETEVHITYLCGTEPTKVFDREVTQTKSDGNYEFSKRIFFYPHLFSNSCSKLIGASKQGYVLNSGCRDKCLEFGDGVNKDVYDAGTIKLYTLDKAPTAEEWLRINNK